MYDLSDEFFSSDVISIINRILMILLIHRDFRVIKFKDVHIVCQRALKLSWRFVVFKDLGLLKTL